MTRLRAVDAKRACEARSSGPPYASTSTMRASRRPVVVVADQPRAEQPWGDLLGRSGQLPSIDDGQAGGLG